MTRGIILTNGTPNEGLIYHMALVFESSYAYVRDFQLMPIIHKRLKYRAVNAREFQERRPVRKETLTEDTLIYGEVLDWDEYDSKGRALEIVDNYKRAPQIFKSRIFNGETQLLLMGMMSKNRKVLWMLDIWPDLEIPFRLQHCSHPNVVIEAWVTLQLMPNQSLKYELHSFANTADTFQHLCRNARWNEGDDGNLVPFYDFLTRENQDQVYVPSISSTITSMQGIVISNKMVVSIDSKHRDICFHRVVLNEEDTYPKNGSHVKFNAEKLDYLNIYALNNVSVSTGHKSYPLTDDGQIKVSIRAVEDLPGFFHSKTLDIYLDDPENILECWLLSVYAKSGLQVSITAGEPSDKGTPRFVVTGVTDSNKRNKVELLREEGKIELANERAVVINEFGKLHLPRLPKTVIRLPKELAKNFPPGTVLRVCAKLEKRWKCISAELDMKVAPFLAMSRIDQKTGLETTLFMVPEVKGCKELPFFLKSDIFGLIHTPRSFKIRRLPEQLVFRNVWVSLNDCHPGDVLLPPAKFKFAAIENDVENTCPIAPVSSQKIPDEDEEQQPEGRAEYALNQFSVPTVYSALRDEEVENQMKVKGVSVVQMIRNLQGNREFETDPLRVVNREIKDHMDRCQTCVDRKFSEECYFAEFLAYALRMKPEIADALKSKHLLSFVACRRFKQ